MLCIELHHNGRRIARGGIRRGVLSGMLTWVSRPGKIDPDKLPPHGVIPGIDCRLGGLNTARSRHEEHIDWALLRELRLGDEILFRLTRASRPDVPTRREASAVDSGRRKGLPVTRCSFCRKDRPARRQSGTPNIVTGVGGAICANCILLADALREAKRTRLLHLHIRRAAKCSFCIRDKRCIAAAAGANICTVCLKSLVEGL
jgi:hypothetical protein